MSGESYYYVFSLVLALSLMLYLTNLVLLRTKGKSTFGISYKPGSSAHHEGIKFASSRHISIVGLLSLAAVANLLYDIKSLIDLDNNTYPISILWALTAFILFLFFIIIIFAGRYARNLHVIDVREKKK